MHEMIQSVYRYRGFILSSVKRDFQSRYQKSMLGAAWLVIQPLAMILVYTLVLAKVMQSKLAGVDGTFAYSIYLCSGILTWSLFTEILNRTTIIFIENGNLLKKLSFPRICLPIIVISSACLSFTIIFSLFSIFLMVSNNFPGLVYLSIIPTILALLIFVVGLGMILGVLNVFFRDIGQLVGVVTQFWFWLTPIVYPAHILPNIVSKLLIINPVYPVVKAMQGIFVNQQVPDWLSLLYPVLFGCVLLWIGFSLFRKHSDEIVDEL